MHGSKSLFVLVFAFCFYSISSNAYPSYGTVKREPTDSEDLADGDDNVAEQEKLHLSAHLVSPGPSR